MPRSTAPWKKPISIHALREEGDSRYPGVMRKFHYFYPRPPRGGRPGFLPWTTKPNYFYPRPPRGGRPPLWHIRCRTTQFLSTPSARRATAVWLLSVISSIFLSTPSARRATKNSPAPGRQQQQFLSTPSARRATVQGCKLNKPKGISIHALREEGDGDCRMRYQIVYIFLSTPSARRAT